MILNFIVVLLGVTAVQAGLFGHCLRNQILGQWTIDLQIIGKNLSVNESACGHEVPDIGLTSYKSLAKDFKPNMQSISVFFQDKSRAIFADQSEGKWTMVYDQGFDLTNGLKSFTTYFSYYIRRGGIVVSDCSSTIVGWYHDLQTKESGCFRARKADEDRKIFIVHRDEFDFVDTSRFPAEYSQLDSKINNLLQDTNGYQWRKVLKKGISLEDLATMKEKGDFYEVQKPSQINMNAQLEPLNGLPANFDWKNVMNEALDQGRCGMCYAVSTVF